MIPAVLGAALAGCPKSPTPEVEKGNWPFIGGSITNTRHASREHIISPVNAAHLAPKWSTVVRGVQQETPISDGETLFVANAQGGLFWIAQTTGEILREVDVKDVLETPGISARGLAVTDTAIIFGTRNKPLVAALDKATGALLWKTAIDEHPMASVTQPPIVHNGRVYVGTSGLGEEVQATYGTYEECCVFRGSAVALDETTGEMLWKTYTLPEGFAGGSLWSRTPSIDEKRNTLYVTTGNAYAAPDDVQACVDKKKAENPSDLPSCFPPGVWNDSILALNPDTGAIKWGFRADHFDIFTGACLVPEQGGFCGGGDDVDFGNGALIWQATDGHNTRDLVGAGQKSGTFWALDRDTGKVVWNAWLGPAGPTGGILKGSATDGARIYIAEGNSKQVRHFPKEHTLISGKTIKYGSFAAVDAATGEIIWQIPDPAGKEFPGNDTPCEVGSPSEDCSGAFPKGPVTVANGVVYACSTAPPGPMYAFDATSGALLWRFDSGSRCDSGAAVIDGVVYWVGGRELHAFAIAPPQI